MTDAEMRAYLAQFVADNAEDENHPGPYGSRIRKINAAFRRLLDLLPPADDAEPVTEEWLRAVGMIEPDRDSAPDKGYYGDLVRAVVCPGQFGSRFGFMYSDGTGGWSWWACLLTADGFDGTHDYLCPIPTRGDVRRLCATLKITPNPTE